MEALQIGLLALAVGAMGGACFALLVLWRRRSAQARLLQEPVALQWSPGAARPAGGFPESGGFGAGMSSCIARPAAPGRTLARTSGDHTVLYGDEVVVFEVQGGQSSQVKVGGGTSGPLETVTEEGGQAVAVVTEEKPEEPEVPEDPYFEVPVGGSDEELEAVVQQWVEAITVEKCGEGQSFGEWTKDGVVLCTLVNTIKPGTVKVVNKQKMPFKQMENITNFVRACREMGVLEFSLFAPVDLYEAKNIKAVVLCVLNLGAACRRSAPGFRGPHLGVPQKAVVKDTRRKTAALADGGMMRGMRQDNGPDKTTAPAPYRS